MTYVLLSVGVLALIAAVTVPTLRRLPQRPLLLTGAVLIVLTAIFDNVIVGLDIVGYDPRRISGIRVGKAPLEDFSYTLGAVMMVPALWTWLGPRHPHPSTPAPTSPPDPDPHHPGQ
ncbi:lycopene cyclase domain-containing protein [Demequina lignilytica]|uniref:Lycopene cyclase domain-containing protein n=1 Tax=Demequina lignilytica TaxID=3051663 RepID=A0AB35MI84_9MICO|nr:lycopene cyclase domain-containing protein [Demequina sp. SYSU T0a273]MDN4483420.1 lycopene cyclase domain-containing protein [Demequina sp. SYSU T0a273]